MIVSSALIVYVYVFTQITYCRCTWKPSQSPPYVTCTCLFYRFIVVFLLQARENILVSGLSENSVLLVKAAELLAEGGVTDTLFQNTVTVASLPSKLNDTLCPLNIKSVLLCHVCVSFWSSCTLPYSHKCYWRPFPNVPPYTAASSSTVVPTTTTVQSTPTQ